VLIVLTGFDGRFIGTLESFDSFEDSMIWIEEDAVMIEDADMYLLLVAELDRKEKQYSKLIIINEIRNSLYLLLSIIC
jgi:hypothetical protein